MRVPRRRGSRRGRIEDRRWRIEDRKEASFHPRCSIVDPVFSSDLFVLGVSALVFPYLRLTINGGAALLALQTRNIVFENRPGEGPATKINLQTTAFRSWGVAHLERQTRSAHRRCS